DRQTRLLEQANTLSADAGDAIARAETIAAEIAELRTALGERDEHVEAERTALEVETAATRERLKAARSDVERALSSARQADEEAARRKTAIGTCEQERNGYETRSGEVEKRIAEPTAALEAAEAESARFRQDRDTLLTETSGERASAQEAEQKSSGLQDTLRKAELRAAQLETERTMLIQRLDVILHGERETTGEGDEEDALVAWDADSVDSLLAEAPIPDGFARHGAVIEWNRLKREIAALGVVNPNADTEFQELSERRKFLTGQREDLFAADAKLRSVIQDIDRSTRQTFVETFQQVEEQFKIMFERLFGGGMTRLVLTDPDNVLDSGIDIIAQPPGKKLQNLALLSGGERALTAAALMFAFLRVRPSPFCVLDELDAPLDEANVGRFADILRDFTDHSSFVVITHNRGTMEVADALYGISMQEPGVSTVVSLKMEAEEKPA
ncbi:MAG: chromosome segregation protein SMC, partial [Armatimonadetes bacterium]|nr:chromosome segregation protein SMC [Armatimonadota bacterium]